MPISGWEKEWLASLERDRLRANLGTDEQDPADDRHDAVTRLMADNDRLRSIVESLAARCHAQSEVLAKKAEKGGKS